MPSYKIDLEEPVDDRVRESAHEDHRPVLWQIEHLIREALDRRDEQRRPETVPAEIAP